MEEEIIEQIRSFLTPKFASKSFVLEFTYNEKRYKVRINAVHTDEKIAIENPCVMMDFIYLDPDTKDGTWLGEITADIEEVACFDPRLVTNARNKPGKRTTSADVLQVLKTKLALAFPVRIPVALIDGAQTNMWMKISPFHIMRGGDAFYEKYGYRSPEISELKAILPSIKWSDCVPEQKDIILNCTKVDDYPSDMPLITIMKTISWEQEDRWSNENNKTLSYRVFRLFAITQGYSSELTMQGGIPDSRGVLQTIWTHTLDSNDPKWKRWNSELIFTAFHPELSGGKRKNRKTRRRKHSRRKSRKVTL